MSGHEKPSFSNRKRKASKMPIKFYLQLDWSITGYFSVTDEHQYKNILTNMISFKWREVKPQEKVPTFWIANIHLSIIALLLLFFSTRRSETISFIHCSTELEFCWLDSLFGFGDSRTCAFSTCITEVVGSSRLKQRSSSFHQ